MAKQRAGRNRRPLNYRQSWKPQLLLVGAAIEDDNTISLECEQGVRLLGIPNIYASNHPFVYPVAAQIDPGDPEKVLLTYDVNISTAETVSIQPWDEAIRTASGGYLAPGLRGLA